MSDLSERIASLSGEQREILLRKLKGKSAGPSAPLQPRPPSAQCPLSHSQQLMWLLNQLVAEPSVYHVPMFLRLRGELNQSALENALNTILERHEVLRSNVDVVDGALFQTVRDDRPIRLAVSEVPGATAEEREAAIGPICLAAARREFDFARDLPIRASLLRVGAGDHLLLMVANHIAFDGWSRKIFLNELSALYAASCEGRPNPLPPLPLQYADFAYWQRTGAQAEVIERQLGYWKQRLAGAPDVLDLPVARPRPAVQTFRGGRTVAYQPIELLDRFAPFARTDGATQFMVLMAAFNLLLFRYSGREDIVIGTPILGRLTPSVEPLIGYFSNTLLIRIDLSGDPSFRELLERVRTATLEALEHQEVPLELLTIELHPERNAGRSPLFQVMLSLTQERARPPELKGLDVSVVRVDRGIARLDLTMGLSIGREDFATLLEYSSDMFDGAAMSAMLAHFHNLLASAAANPDERISRLRMTTDSERRNLIAMSCGSPAAPDGPSVHGLFETQAALTPAAPALAFEQRTLSYADLNARANRIARCLVARGVQPGAMVGLCMGRSLDMVAGILAILKAGAACVPLDPGSPKQRLEMIVDDTGMRMVLTQDTLRGQFVECGVEALALDADGGETAGQGSENLDIGVRPDDVAYVIYTSGSTGRPKGVLLVHRGLVNQHVFARQFYGLGPQDRVLQSSPISFDIALEEIFPALASGAAVVLRPDGISLGGRGFLEWLGRQRITVLDVPTAFWHQWTSEIASLGRPLPGDIRLVIVGGEKAQTPAFLKWRELAGSGIRWINTYGPTEASIIVTAYEPGDAELDARVALPIGRPIAGARTYILDQNRELVPLGVPGELYVGGDVVARGYLNQPELNAQRFVPDPFNDDPAARCFRTGDMARMLSDGNIEYLGRADRQVKIRGFRVEPGEVEAALLTHPDVEQAAVIEREDGTGQMRLVAYVALASGQRACGQTDEKELRAYLKARLPEYMVPAAFVSLPDLPRTDRGKVDRGRLPAPEAASGGGEDLHLPPRDALEIQLAKIWERILGVKNVGVRDSFFDLGGHSLLAVALFAQIEKVLGKSLPPATLFQAQTVEELAAVLRGQGSPSTWSSLVPIQPRGSRPPLFCVHAQSGQVLFYHALARHLGKQQPLYGLQSLGLDGARPPLASVEQMAEHYLGEIRTVQPEGPYYLAGFCLGGYVAFEMARQLEAVGQQVALCAVFDTDGAWRMTQSVLGGVDYHRRRMRGMRLHETIVYLAQRTRFRLARTKYGLAQFAAESMVSLRQALPRTLRELHIFETNFRANHDYAPQPFGGRITYFRGAATRSSDPALFWNGVAQGGIEIQVVPGKGRTLFQEPHVQGLAKALAAALEEAGARP